MVEVSQLYKDYKNQSVLRGINLSCQSGQIYGLMGENGSGKTTFFHCLLGLVKYTGSIRFIDKKIKIGYLPVELFFYSHITGLEYLEFCIMAKGERINKKRIESINNLFKLPLNKYASEYSAGMKKKIGFMSLLLQNNDLFIMDEPFNGLDLLGCIHMKQILLELKNKNKTIILSSHIISSLVGFCDKIHYLNSGKITKTYTFESIYEIEQDITSSLNINSTIHEIT